MEELVRGSGFEVDVGMSCCGGVVDVSLRKILRVRRLSIEIVRPHPRG